MLIAWEVKRFLNLADEFESSEPLAIAIICCQLLPHVCQANDEEGAKVLWARTATYPKLRMDIRSEGPSRGAARKSVVGSKESV